MKMSEVFTGGKVVEIGGYHDNGAYINTEEHGFGTDEDGVSDAVIRAINMHDELVEITEKLVATVNWLKDTDEVNGAPEYVFEEIEDEINQAAKLIKEAKS